jgi:AraC-like DNA-binding protein
METRFHMPREAPLSDAVQLFWQVNRDNIKFREETIVPKGVVEIIFNFLPEKTFNGKLYNGAFSMPRCFIQGYHTGIIEMDLPDSQFLFGVVLQPAATKHILRVPAGAFARQCIDLTSVDASFNALWHQLAEQGTFRGKVGCFSTWLTKRLPRLTTREHALNNVLALKTEFPLSVPNLSERLCYSPRHLSRMFHEMTGMNSEQTLLYLKYLKAVSLIHYSGLSLTQIAYASGFSDQSHFIKVFKSFTMLTPHAYKARKSGIPAHLFGHGR